MDVDKHLRQVERSCRVTLLVIQNYDHQNQPLDQACRFELGGSGCAKGCSGWFVTRPAFDILGALRRRQEEGGGGVLERSCPLDRLQSGIVPSFDPGSTSLLFILPGTSSIKPPPSHMLPTRRFPHFPRWPLQTKTWPMSRRHPPTQPASLPMGPTSTQRAMRPSRGLNARQVRLSSLVHFWRMYLSPPQISMISLGGAVGTGLIIGSGTALVR